MEERKAERRWNEEARMDELLRNIEEKPGEIPYVDKLMEIKEIGLVSVSGFIAEVGDIGRFDNPKQLQKLAGSWQMIQESTAEKAVSVTGAGNA